MQPSVQEGVVATLRWGGRLLNYYFSVLTNFSFRGRARRAEYWSFFITSVMLAFVLGFVGRELDLMIDIPDDDEDINILEIGYGLLTLVQECAVSFRRFHDRALSGWWALPIWAAACVAGVVAMIIFEPFFYVAFYGAAAPFFLIAVLPGTAGTNKYGTDPKAAGA